MTAADVHSDKARKQDGEVGATGHADFARHRADVWAPAYGRTELHRRVRNTAAFVAQSGLFTANPTSNLVLIGAVMVHPGAVVLAKLPPLPCLRRRWRETYAQRRGGCARSRPGLAAFTLECTAGALAAFGTGFSNSARGDDADGRRPKHIDADHTLSATDQWRS